ncbi:MAG: hypothetical protein KC550_03580 [Nanoarchaeota archaeon]|nr:hypothetical protein [Nanoarchaeota archaeon]
MDEKIINPFAQNKKTNWAKKAQNRLSESRIKDVQNSEFETKENKNNSKDDNNNNNTEVKEEIKNKTSIKIENKKLNVNKKQCKKTKNINVERVAKSFKIYPGKISRDFDKRVNKLQVHFDDLDFNKNYVDSGKYMMFLMSFAEKFDLYELYKEVENDGEISLTLNEVKKFFENKK